MTFDIPNFVEDTKMLFQQSDEKVAVRCLLLKLSCWHLIVNPKVFSYGLDNVSAHKMQQYFH